jgi:hypothetical protein
MGFPPLSLTVQSKLAPDGIKGVVGVVPFAVESLSKVNEPVEHCGEFQLPLL